MAAEYVCCFLTSHQKYTLRTANKERWTLTTANRMLRNCQEDVRFCYDIHEKLYNKYDLCYAVPQGARCSSVDSVPAFEAVGRRIDPSQWTQLQFGLFSVPTSGPQLVYQRPWYVLFCLWKSAYKRSLAAYRKE